MTVPTRPVPSRSMLAGSGVAATYADRSVVAFGSSVNGNGLNV